MLLRLPSNEQRNGLLLDPYCLLGRSRHVSVTSPHAGEIFLKEELYFHFRFNLAPKKV